MPCNTDLDLRVKHQAERSQGWITCLAVEGTKIYTDNRHGGISAREMGERGRERWARAEFSGTCCSRILIFIWHLIKLSSMTSRFFASLPWTSIPIPCKTKVEYVITYKSSGKNKSERGWSAPRTSRTTIHKSLGKVENRPPALLSSLATLRVSIFGWWYKQSWQIPDKTK